ncbi:DNA polymerase ligase-domain-containing protein [Lasiosphaeria hispida]|uniref:DNA polymerase ligase-domain-containing protein n=1 Tax=Lasiosphaeria hispida TaxID=260671 RepID=A0AAJ0HTN1_9PEZI|nr:DNA polymerase ligase-domain-containing protein [Lasiosphaeria hispida]
MASDRSISSSPELVPNPSIKKRNLEWRLSPPPLKRQRQQPPAEDGNTSKKPPPTTTPQPSTSALIESQTITITDHAAHFAPLLSHATLDPYPAHTSRLPIHTYQSLYASSLHSSAGAHFVIHQHDHPVAGTHYDLRLQINGTSSASWAVMYGLPGDPNGARQNRNATETRVHCLWNHLIETAGAETGSLLLWDTGTYAVLPRRSKHAPAVDPESGSEEEGEQSQGETEQERLRAAFAARKIRLRLDGARLPRGYVVNLRLTKGEDAAGRAKALRAAEGKGSRKRRRAGGVKGKPLETSSSSEGTSDDEVFDGDAVAKTAARGKEQADKLSAMERELRELEDEEVRRTNAYTGASNTIGSVYQRRWYLSLDRTASGFVKRQKGGAIVWEKEGDGKAKVETGQEERETPYPRLDHPFYVRGPDHERSVITGRLSADVLRDEGVKGFVGRKGWRPVLK